MDFISGLPLSPTLQRELSEHLHTIGSTLSISEAAEHALRHWMAADAPAEPAQSTRGYQWKSLFLPNTTELRMMYDDKTYYARVAGDRIVYQGRSVTPRTFTLAIAGNGRNAWRDLWLKFPGQAHWKRAFACRNEQQASTAKVPGSPLESMQAAAAAMSLALNTALALVEHSNAQSLRKVERRLERHRRSADTLADDCRFD